MNRNAAVSNEVLWRCVQTEGHSVMVPSSCYDVKQQFQFLINQIWQLQNIHKLYRACKQLWSWSGQDLHYRGLNNEICTPPCDHV